MSFQPPEFCQMEYSWLMLPYSRKFGGGKVWRSDSVRAFDERKFGELIDQLIDYLL